MNIGQFLSKIFERIPEKHWKNDIRYFLAFNPMIPKFIQDISPIKGYELYYKIKPGDVVVDAGAFTGDYTIFAAKKVGEQGKVVAFEPDKNNRIILRRNLKKKNLSNVIIVPKGLWDEETSLSIEQSDGLHTTISSKGDVHIQVTRLDTELKKLKINHIDVLKMDIEGAEVEAIEGCKKTLLRDKPYVAIASYHIRNKKPTSIFIENFLKKLGYITKSDFFKHRTTYGLR